MSVAPATAPFVRRLGADLGNAVLVGVPIDPVESTTRAALIAPLHPDEAMLASPWADRRVRTFSAGRTALREALRHLEVSVDGAILPTPRGAPAVPPSLRVSVSHKEDIAVAVAARAEDIDGAHLGVDVEVLDATRTDVSRLVLTDAERERLVLLDEVHRARAVLLRFSLKEALYKALDPFVKRYVGFHEVEVEPNGDGSAVFALALKNGEGPFGVTGTWFCLGSLVLTAVRVDAR